jgi:hypothetical protein
MLRRVHAVFKIDAQMPRNGRTHLPGIQNFALNLAGTGNILGQMMKLRILPDIKAELFHPAQKPPL